MKTKIEYEKVDYDFWNLSELNELFENGELYYNARDYFFRFETLTDLGVAASIKDTIYKRVETQITLDDELNEMSSQGVSASCNDGIIALSDEDSEMHVSCDFILKIAEIIKRHRKE